MSRPIQDLHYGPLALAPRYNNDNDLITIERDLQDRLDAVVIPLFHVKRILPPVTFLRKLPWKTWRIWEAVADHHEKQEKTAEQSHAGMFPAPASFSMKRGR
jgi:hypothetical protein